MKLTLNDLNLNQKGYIKNINCNNSIKRRLLDLGLTEKTPISPVLISPFKEPKAYSVRGCTIAIRKEDAQKIEIYLHTNQ